MKDKTKRIGRWIGALVIVLIASAILFNSYADYRVLGEYFDSDGVKIHFTDEGTGEPVILIHGFAANADLNWRKWGVNKELRKDYRVIALDNRGHGLSDKPESQDAYGIEMVNDVVRLMDHLQIDKAHVVGYSMGGFLTMKLLIEHPERIISAMPCGAGWPRIDEESTSTIDRIASGLENEGTFAPLLEHLTPLDSDVNKLEVASMDRVIRSKADPAIMALAMRGMLEFAVEPDQLKANPVPVKTLIGSVDPLRETVEPLEGLLANFEAVYLEDGDHLSTLSMDEFIEEIEAFLGAHRLNAPIQQEDAA